MPGDGSEVHSGRVAEGPDTNVVEVPAEKPSFKDQVLGYAKVTRGKVSIVSNIRQNCLLTRYSGSWQCTCYLLLNNILLNFFCRLKRRKSDSASSKVMPLYTSIPWRRNNGYRRELP